MYLFVLAFFFFYLIVFYYFKLVFNLYYLGALVLSQCILNENEVVCAMIKAREDYIFMYLYPCKFYTIGLLKKANFFPGAQLLLWQGLIPNINDKSFIIFFFLVYI